MLPLRTVEEELWDLSQWHELAALIPTCVFFQHYLLYLVLKMPHPYEQCQICTVGMPCICICFNTCWTLKPNIKHIGSQQPVEFSWTPPANCPCTVSDWWPGMSASLSSFGFLSMCKKIGSFVVFQNLKIRPKPRTIFWEMNMNISHWLQDGMQIFVCPAN